MFIRHFIQRPAVGKAHFNRRPIASAQVPQDIERHGDRPVTYLVVARNPRVVDLVFQDRQVRIDGQEVVAPLT